jgi:hypothetical protein
MIPSSYKTRRILTLCLTFLLLLIPFKLLPQKVADFSGKWILNSSKSSSVLAGLTSTVIITQSGNKISLNITLIPKGSKPENKTEEYVLGTSMGGRSKTKNYTIDALWLSDKQSFSITEVISNIENGITKESRNVKVYSLTDEGKTMTVKSDNTPPQGSTTPENQSHTIMVYDKSL